ncbi:Rubber elongation factor protein (REF) [Quillaja saponaria]|uniref:Rubber elongation factor protein (REF) n=1 Tax=Quillaja saponaria TaxID=32244 RepID=A0AAD7QAS1_QUISA|nr:Rubber elongation factor protein (REF) [Quillaja saponaria]
MAEANPVQHDMAKKEEEQRLKYLEFVQVASIHALMCFCNLYVYAKDKSGPLKPRVEIVEGTVKSVVGPVYDKFHEVPVEVLKYVDRKVDESVTSFDRRVPPTLKQVSAQALTAAQKAPEVARNVASELKRAGVKDTASGLAKSVYTKYEPTAKDLYSKYEPKAEQCAASAWRKLNKLPIFPQVANVVVPTAAYYTEKYNDTVRSSAEKGYRVSSYLPLVPTEKIARVFNDDVVEPEPLVSSGGETIVAAH